MHWPLRPYLNHLLTILVVLLITGTNAQSSTRLCNNAAALCSRRYDNVTYLGAHDSPYVRNATNGYTVAGNQLYTTIQQLDSGIRLLSAQIHAVTVNGQTQIRLCHTLCQLYDAGLLVDWLGSIKSWLTRNPNEVITILLVNSDNTPSQTLSQIYTTSGIDTLSYTPPSQPSRTITWPTLGELITSNTRVLNFIASLDQTPSQTSPYLLNEFSYIFETSYTNYNPTDFTCIPDRPATLSSQSITSTLNLNYLPLLNHFLYSNISGIQIPNISAINITNSPSLSAGPGNLLDHANTCTALYGRAPSYILTDFSNVGPAMNVVDRLNGVLGFTGGRVRLSDSVAGSMADPGGVGSGSTSMSASVSATGTGSVTGSSTISSSGGAMTSRSVAVRKWVDGVGGRGRVWDVLQFVGVSFLVSFGGWIVWMD